VTIRGPNVEDTQRGRVGGTDQLEELAATVAADIETRVRAGLVPELDAGADARKRRVQSLRGHREAPFVLAWGEKAARRTPSRGLLCQRTEALSVRRRRKRWGHRA
jgi:hypothetical protein